MKLDVSKLVSLKNIYCSDQNAKAWVTKFRGRYVLALATMRTLRVAAADDSDSFTAEAQAEDVSQD